MAVVLKQMTHIWATCTPLHVFYKKLTVFTHCITVKISQVQTWSCLPVCIDFTSFSTDMMVIR